MKLISHRGNIDSINRAKENTQPYIQNAIDHGYDVEIDVRLMGSKLYLGHDSAENLVTLDWLKERQSNLWIHCKNVGALTLLLNQGLVVFFHEKESYTIISNGQIWAHDLSLVNNKCVIPLLSKKEITNWQKQNVYGVCSDYISLLKND